MGNNPKRREADLIEDPPKGSAFRRQAIVIAIGIALIAAIITFTGAFTSKANAEEATVPQIELVEPVVEPVDAPVEETVEQPGWFTGIKARFSQAGAALSGDPQAIVAEFNSQLIADRADLDERMEILLHNEAALVYQEQKLLALKTAVEDAARQLLTASNNGQNTLVNAIKRYETEADEAVAEAAQ